MFAELASHPVRVRSDLEPREPTLLRDLKRPQDRELLPRAGRNAPVCLDYLLDDGSAPANSDPLLDDDADARHAT